LWLSQIGGFPMHQTFVDSSARPSFAERLEVIAQRLEGPAWIGLIASFCYAGFLAISI
jgi:hypothetical protein